MTPPNANIRGAKLSGADLSNADLSGADLSGANLSRADLSGADLSGANLSGANLSGAEFFGAEFFGADLSNADLSRADLFRAINIFSAGPLGVEGRLVYAVRHPDGVRIQAGCFWGSAAEIRAAIAERYADGTGRERHRAAYLGAIDLIETWASKLGGGK